MKSPCPSHEHFGELSAMAGIGQLSPEEYLELKAHLESCAACRQEHALLTRFQLTDLPLAHGADESWSVRRSTGAPVLTGRLERAWQTRWHFLHSKWALSYAAVLILFLLGSALVLYRHEKLDDLRNAELVRLRKALDNIPQPSATVPVPPRDLNSPKVAAPPPPVAEADSSKLIADKHSLELRLESASQELQTLQDQARSGLERESQLAARLSETENSLANLKNELQSAREVHAQDEAAVSRQQEQLQKLNERLAAATDSIERDKALLVADRDIRDLMGARALRIVDVFDVDGKGATRKPFGRVFFTEGKSLIFYAFDLPNADAGLQSSAYQAWGYEGSYQRGVRSLGVFYQDDQKASRWVLKFDDPHTLAEIDSVFVTIEPPGGSKKPTGSKLLAAYLKGALNHP